MIYVTKDENNASKTNCSSYNACQIRQSKFTRLFWTLNYLSRGIGIWPRLKSSRMDKFEPRYQDFLTGRFPLKEGEWGAPQIDTELILDNICIFL